jgi:hypothetical protein
MKRSKVIHNKDEYYKAMINLGAWTNESYKRRYSDYPLESEYPLIILAYSVERHGKLFVDTVSKSEFRNE